MRPIGTIQDETQAMQFGGFLSVREIANQVDKDSRGDWEVWILDDDNIEKAKSLLEQFRRNPNDPIYAEASQAVVRQRQQEETAEAPSRVRSTGIRAIFGISPVPIGFLSVALIAISVAVTILAAVSKDDRLIQTLLITQVPTTDGGNPSQEKGLPEIRNGQVWRLFTPIFIHFGILHILFNMLWLWDLGSMIEARRGPWLLLLLTLVLAGTSNLAQYVLDGPVFGGMSGVVYGLLGYIWMQGRFNPASRLSLQPQTVTFMLVWFFVCLSGLVGPVANAAHAVGLAVGTTWGFLAAQLPVVLRRY